MSTQDCDRDAPQVVCDTWIRCSTISEAKLARLVAGGWERYGATIYATRHGVMVARHLLKRRVVR
jgi:hypothetical protein